MKQYNKIISAIGAVALAAGMWSCQADMETPDLQVPEASIKPNITILDLKNRFEGQTVLLDRQEDGSPYIIHGRVVSSDASGNIYQNLVIQDETGALTFSIRQKYMSSSYRLGQDVVVDMTGLYLGYYRGLQQVGAPSDPYNGTPQLGFMSYDLWLRQAQKNGLPDPAMEVVGLDQEWPAGNMYAVSLTLPIANTDLTRKQSLLVELRNVHFVGAGKLKYGVYAETVTRYLKNEEGDSIAVRFSGYSNFYNDVLPEGTGRVRGILGYYGDSWQLTPRDVRDVMISKKGMKDEPYTVQEALLPDNYGNSGWTAGYIVGSVKAGEDAEDNGDCIFGAAAEMDNNLLIADSPDETDLARCLTVTLPQGSLLRRYGNLVDNPGVYKKKLTVKGEIGTFLKHTGVVDNEGTVGTFEIEGVEIKVPTGDFKEVFKSLETNSTAADVNRDWTFENVTLASGLSYVWGWKVYNGSGYLNGSAYAGGSAKEALSYAVSPVIDLTEMLEAKASFRHAAKFQTTLRDLCGFAVREAGSDTWTEFPIPVWPTAAAWKFVGSGDIDISSFAGKRIQIAFKYGSSAAGADTWEINDATVMAR